MKIGISSFHNSINYGAVLQIYALKKNLEKLGGEVSVIDYRALNSEYADFSLKKGRQSMGFPRAFLKFLFYHMFSKKLIVNKMDKFDDFVSLNFNLTRKYNSIEDFINENNLDIMICGSDQIWNPEITNGFNKMMFGDFNSSTIKKYSYAASVGDVKIINTKNRKTEFLELIKNFDAISVREKELAEFITDNFDENPLVVLDPTLLLDADEYLPIIDTTKLKEKYVLVYQLSRYPRVIEIARNLAKEYNLEIIEIINNPFEFPRNKSMLFDVSPSEFLNLIKNAEYVVTNSFHGTAFSIIFKKNFYTVASRLRNSRITNLLDTLGLSDRLIIESNDEFPSNKIDYEKVDIVLSRERETSINFLKIVSEG